MKTEMILGYSPLDNGVYAGKARIKGTTAIMTGQRHDVTSHFWNCVVQAASYSDGPVQFEVDGYRFEMDVREKPTRRQTPCSPPAAHWKEASDG